MKIKPLLLLFSLITAWPLLAGNAPGAGTNDATLTDPATRAYLQSVLDSLGRVRSAVYYQINESWQPGDTVPTVTRRTYTKEYDNPADTIVGAGYVNLNGDDTTVLNGGYNGDMRVVVYHEDKYIVTDDFSLKPYPIPFRMVHSFYNVAKSIVRYALDTDDSIHIELEDRGDHYYFELTVNEDHQVEFVGGIHYNSSPYILDHTSVHKLWIGKADGLPYRHRREMSHDVSDATVVDPVFNTLDINDFNMYSHFDPEYEIRPWRSGRTTERPDMTGQKAPDWTLDDMHGQPVSLSGQKSKVVLLQFTGIGCGPCLMSYPLLISLKNRFTADRLQVIAIETWQRKPHSLQFYAAKNGIDFPFLCGTEQVVEDYKTGNSAPVFFFIDSDRVIRKVIRGYHESMDEEIIDAISRLLYVRTR